MAKLGGKVVVNGLAGACVALVVSVAACGSDDGGGQPPASAGSGGSASDGGSASETPEGGGGGSKTEAGTSGSGGSLPATNGGEGGQSSPNSGSGGEGGALPDPLGAGGWESVHGDPPLDPDCGDYEELFDRTNAGGAEDTGITVDATAVTICGRLDAYHFNPRPEAPGYGYVDEDAFTLAFAGDGDYLVSLELLGDEVPEYTYISVNPGISGGGAAQVLGKAAGAFVRLADPQVPIYVSATGSKPLKASVPYKLRIRRDSPQTRCPTIAAGNATQKYVEANDGANNNGNDVIRYVFQTTQQVPTPAADAPEPTGIVLKPGDHSLIQGSSALVDYQEDYADADMFAFSTGASGVLTARLDWAGNKTDLDVMLFEENEYANYVGYSAQLEVVGPELFTLHVKPQTKYWLYVAADATSPTLPMAYGLTLCGEEFKP